MVGLEEKLGGILMIVPFDCGNVKRGVELTLWAPVNCNRI